MSQFFIHQTTAAEPKPGATQEGSDAPDFGSYQTSFDADLIAPTAAGGTRTITYASGIDDLMHYSQSMGFITFPLVAGSTGLGVFQADIFAAINAIPLGISYVIKGALFKWLANDTLSGQLGVTATSTNLTTTQTKYTLTFSASLNDTVADGDRYYLEIWVAHQDAASLGDTGIYVYSIRINDGQGTIADSSFTVPGTQTQLVTFRGLPLVGVGK